MQINIQITKGEDVDTSTQNWKNYWIKIIWEVNATFIKIWEILKKKKYDDVLSQKVLDFFKKRGNI